LSPQKRMLISDARCAGKTWRARAPPRCAQRMQAPIPPRFFFCVRSETVRHDGDSSSQRVLAQWMISPFTRNAAAPRHRCRSRHRIPWRRQKLIQVFCAHRLKSCRHQPRSAPKARLGKPDQCQIGFAGMRFSCCACKNDFAGPSKPDCCWHWQSSHKEVRCSFDGLLQQFQREHELFCSNPDPAAAR